MFTPLYSLRKSLNIYIYINYNSLNMSIYNIYKKILYVCMFISCMFMYCWKNNVLHTNKLPTFHVTVNHYQTIPCSLILIKINKLIKTSTENKITYPSCYGGFQQWIP